MAFSYIMTAGYMIVKVDEYELIHYFDNGEIEWFHTYMGDQWGTEILIVSATNAIIALGVILIIEAAGGVRKDSEPRVPYGKTRRVIQSVVGLLMTCFFFAKMLQFYRIKDWGYPYSYTLEELFNTE